jgi:transcriptional regulator with XRE-family HTH domain
MFDEDQVTGQHRQIETIKRAVKGQSERGLYLRGLRACRTAAMLNQRELAARAHMYQSTINALERQNRAASLTMVRRLCEALDVGPADLCSADPEHPSDKDFTVAVKKTGGADEDVKTISNREEQRQMYIDFNDPEQITGENVQKMIASDDDSQNSQVRVSKDGRVYIDHVLFGEERLEGVLFRSETLCAGNGYLGPEAAEDPEYVREVFKDIKQLQKSYKAFKTYGRNARCPVPDGYEGPYI